MNSNSTVKRALVLSGGGARGAYQAGVIKAISEICRERDCARPFDILTGVSAGAINCVYLACHAEDFIKASKRMAATWANIRPEKVFSTDPLDMSQIALKWFRDISLERCHEYQGSNLFIPE